MKKTEGYVALLSVLIVSAATVSIGLGLLLIGADTSRATLVDQQSQQAQNLATACGEEALQVMHDNTAFTGSGNLTLGQGTCTYIVTNTGGANRTIDATGTVNSIVRKVKIYATIGASSISITSWQEVS